MCLSVQNGIDLINAEYYSSMTFEELEKIFEPMSSSAPLPLLRDRLEVLHQTGSILLQVSSLLSLGVFNVFLSFSLRSSVVTFVVALLSVVAVLWIWFSSSCERFLPIEMNVSIRDNEVRLFSSLLPAEGISIGFANH